MKKRIQKVLAVTAAVVFAVSRTVGQGIILYRTMLVLFLAVYLTGSIQAPVAGVSDEDMLTLINDVTAEQNMEFRPDTFGPSEKAILILCGPKSDPAIPFDSIDDIRYTEMLVSDHTKLAAEDTVTLLFTSADNMTSILVYTGFYPASKDDGYVSLEPYHLNVPIGSRVADNEETQNLRKVIFLENAVTHTPDADEELYNEAREDFAYIWSEVLKYRPPD